MPTIRLLLAILALLCPVAVAHADPTPKSDGAILEGTFRKADLAAGKVSVMLPAPHGLKDLTVSDPTAFAALGQARNGDPIKVTVDDAAKPTELKKLLEIQRPVSAVARLLALAGGLVFVWGAAAIMTGGSPLAFFIGVDNRYSNSQTQSALWFGVLFAVYLATVVLRAVFLGPSYIGGVEITANLLGLSGLSAISFAGAKVIMSQKADNAAAQGQPAKARAARPNLLTDLVQNDNRQADLGDFQMILITVIATALFAVSAYFWLGSLAVADKVTLPDIDSALLAAFGIGQGAYLAKKAAMKLGEG